MESWKAFLHCEYLASYETENWFEKYPEYEDDIEDNKKFLEILLKDDGLDPTEALREYLLVLPKCHRYFMCIDDESKEYLLNILIEKGADTTDILDYINVDFELTESKTFEETTDDYNVRGWVIAYMLRNELITPDELGTYFECDWLLIEPEYWEDIEEPKKDAKLSCLKYLKYCSILCI